MGVPRHPRTPLILALVTMTISISALVFPMSQRGAGAFGGSEDL